MRRSAFLIGGLILLCLTFTLYKLYYISPVAEVKPEIENHLDTQFSDQFDITKIEKDYSLDLFHEPVGYKMWLRDKSGFEFGPIFMQFNEVQSHWIPYKGTDIEKDYQKSKYNK